MEFNKFFKIAFISIALIFAYTPINAASTKNNSKQTSTEKKFQAFVEGIKKEAKQKGISEKTIKKYLTNLKAPKKQPLYNIKHQAQKELTFSHYLKNFIPHSSVVEGRKYMKKYRSLLLKVQKKYQVQPRFIVALWGTETNYGKNVGKSPMVKSLVTLAYQHHRSSFYRKQVISALKILNHQKIPQQALSTWDGGMGQPSFEPYIYLNYAVDFDGDGFKNIWTSIPDVFGSIANFLKQNGWHGQQTWGMEVKIPSNLSKTLVGMKTKLSIAKWRSLGVTLLKGGKLPDVNSKASLLLPDSKNGKKGRAFLVFHNFEVLLRWNKSQFEGLAVGILSNEILEQ